MPAGPPKPSPAVWITHSTLPDDALGVLVLPQPFERRMPQLLVRCPAAIDRERRRVCTVRSDGSADVMRAVPS